ncbi:Cof-type HAD-IIB family hydrolase [Streptomyces sp. NPDC001493]
MSTRHDTRPPAAPDIRLIVTDMDGTLLDAEGNVPAGLWPLLEELGRRSIVFSPASGRQYATLAHLFEGADEGMVYIAENGALVVRDGVELSSDPVDPAVSARLVSCVRQLAEDGRNVGVVVCGKRAAYTERGDEAFLAEVTKYYRSHRVVDDATAVDDEIIKIAVLDFDGAEHGSARALEAFSDTHQVVVSGELWIDVMNRTADKGAAVRRLQQRLGIGPEQTMVFGDYLNDLEMLDTADWSFAMANAHPDILRRARHTAPAHTDEGVLRTIKNVLGI